MRLFESVEPRQLFATYIPDVTFRNDGKLQPAERDGFYQSLNFVAQTDRGLLTSVFTRNEKTEATTRRFVNYRFNGTVDSAYAGVDLPDSEGLFGWAADDSGRATYLTQKDARTVELRRYAATGQQDSAFGTNGVTTLAIGDTTGPDGALSTSTRPQIAIAADGSSYVLLSTTTRTKSGDLLNNQYLYRLKPNGQFDSAFGRKQIGRSNALYPSIEATLHVDNSGRAVLTSYSFRAQRFNVLRYTTAGAVDLTFDGDGLFELPRGVLGENDLVRARIDRQGRVLYSIETANSTTLTRLGTDGKPDTSFGTNGTVSGLTTFTDPMVQTILPDDDGNLTLLFSQLPGSTYALVKLNADGSRDTTFGRRGVSGLTNVGHDPVLYAELPDGGLLLTPADFGPLIKFVPRRPFDLAAVSGTLTFYRDPADKADETITVTPLTDGKTRVTFNGQSTDFAAGAVKSIYAELGDGTNAFVSTLNVPSTVIGGTGADTITTGDAEDLIYTLPRGYTDNGSDGFAQVRAGGGADKVFLGRGGAAGYTVDSGLGGGIIENYAGPIEGPVTVTGRSGRWNVTLYAESVNLRLAGLNAAVKLEASGRADVDLTGLRQPALVYGSQGDDRIFTGPASDTVYGNAGNDVIETGDERDRVLAGNGNNTVRGSGGRDTLYGGNGRDLLEGGSNGDLLVGRGGQDTLRGGTGDDRLYAGETSGTPTVVGTNTLDGGPGTDAARRESPEDELISIESVLA